MFRINNSSDATRVSFRLNEEAAAALSLYAEERSRSHGMCARDLVVSALLADDKAELEAQLIRNELSDIRRELTTLCKLRADLASAVNLLLVHAGQLDPDKARAWVNETLSSH